MSLNYEEKFKRIVGIEDNMYRTEEEEKLLREFASKYVFNHLYSGHLHGASIWDKKDASEDKEIEFPPGESLEGRCIVVYGSADNLPPNVPKPENPYKGLLVVYHKNAGPFVGLNS